jgi:Flp pilus assembly protein TadB
MENARRGNGTSSKDSLQERRRGVETKNETTKSKMGIKDYVRWFFVGAFGLILLFTVIMAVYRKYGG